MTRFAALVDEWDIPAARLDDLLAVGRDQSRPIIERLVRPGVEAETRMRRALELGALIGRLLGSVEECRAWLHLPNPAIVGRLAPLDVICDRADGLRAMRDVLREEALQARVPW